MNNSLHYTQNEIDELRKRKTTEIDKLPMSELISLLEEGWVVYDTRCVSGADDVKLLTLAYIKE